MSGKGDQGGHAGQEGHRLEDELGDATTGSFQFERHATVLE